jgi:hypothetical protein
VEFFVISSFHESKIPTVDIEVQVYSKIWKKLKSPCSMREGRFHPPKYRGKVQKIGEETLKGLLSRFLLPTFLGWCIQLLLVGSSTCPPYPYFSSKLQTSITFDP